VKRMLSARTIAALASMVALADCDTAQGRPSRTSTVPAPSEVVEFRALYAGSCAGCHGREGHGGAAISLADPVYLAIADDAAIRSAIANGVRGTAMPAFSPKGGGMLTDAQIDVLSAGIGAWRRPGVLDGAHAPSYAAKAPGDPNRGEEAYGVFCASCHGPRGEGGAKGSSITNDSFLALVSDQGLRTLIIAGRPELGAPGWRGYVPGRPMSDEDVTNVVAWLASRRVSTPGRPYPNDTAR